MKTIKSFIDFKKAGGFEQFRADLTAATEALEKKYGIKITPQKINYTEGYFDVKLNCALIVDGERETKEALEFRQFAHLFGLKKEDLHKLFLYGGKEYKIIGLKSGRSTRNVIVKQGEKQYAIDAKLVVISLNGNPNTNTPAVKSENALIVKLSGNGQERINHPCNTLFEASTAVQKYIEETNIGSSEWSGGNVYNHAGKLVARVSYNGRVWDTAKNPKEITNLELTSDLV